METRQSAQALGALPPDLLRRIRQLEIRARRLVNDLFLGEYLAVFRGRGIEFSEVREYLPGDDIRTIDWNVTARLGEPYVKKFVEERELNVMLAVDVSSSELFGTVSRTKREVATEIAALLAFSAVTSNDKIGLLAFSSDIERFIPLGNGARYVLRLLRELLYLSPRRSGTSISITLDYLSKVLKRRSTVFLISDFLDAGYEPILRVAARRHEIVAISLSDPRELELPDLGLIELEDAETGARVLVDTSDSAVRSQYHERAVQRMAQRNRLLASLSIDHIAVRTDRSYIEPLIVFFRNRARAGSYSARAG
ncbi:MAG TPA: DUF58 domain-containing protein [Dehalococcoidia bacterium]|nr:DUF58 domain-containing protein [Dehalococcoidia bacterium]